MLLILSDYTVQEHNFITCDKHGDGDISFKLKNERYLSTRAGILFFKYSSYYVEKKPACLSTEFRIKYSVIA